MPGYRRQHRRPRVHCLCRHLASPSTRWCVCPRLPATPHRQLTTQGGWRETPAKVAFLSLPSARYLKGPQGQPSRGQWAPGPPHPNCSSPHTQWRSIPHTAHWAHSRSPRPPTAPSAAWTLCPVSLHCSGWSGQVACVPSTGVMSSKDGRLQVVEPRGAGPCGKNAMQGSPGGTPRRDPGTPCRRGRVEGYPWRAAAPAHLT